MRRVRIISAAVTLLFALLSVIVLNLWHISARENLREWPPRHEREIALEPVDDETFFDVVQPSPEPSPVRDNPAPAPLPVKANNQSTPQPRTGQHTTDQGAVGDAPTVATSKQPSPVKQKTEPAPVKTGPSKEELEQQARDEARRKANSATSTAFQRSQGANNTASNGRTPGDSGAPDGKSTSTNGTGTGTVGGGWQIPSYARVPSTVTGSIKFIVTVGKDGRVRNITFNGGEPPAAADSRLVAAVKAEINSRRFTRPNAADAPDQATAYIPYRFK